MRLDDAQGLFDCCDFASAFTAHVRGVDAPILRGYFC